MTADLSLLEKYRPSSLPAPLPEKYVNFLGLQTQADFFGNGASIVGRVFPSLPAGDDGVYGGYPEYQSVLLAINNRARKDTFVAAELGAGWGPWISAAGVVCKNEGVSDITLIGVEADHGKCGFMHEHLENNGLLSGTYGASKVQSTIIEGAAWSEDTVLYFGGGDSRGDHGGAASKDGGSVDYRGATVPKVKVNAFSLETICKPVNGLIDYMHWDIQGAERNVAASGINFLNERVAYLFIGTHSRAVEGSLLELFFLHQWDLVIQNPCHFTYDRLKPSLEGMTTTDGELLLRNPRLASSN